MEAERDAEARYSIQVDRVFLVAMPALFLGRVQLDFASNSGDKSTSYGLRNSMYFEYML